MEIDITEFVETADAYEFSASQAELGTNAGKITWSNAMAEAAERPLLITEDELDACRAWAQGFGAWDAETIAGWTAQECNALLVQYIAGALRELEATCGRDDGTIDWQKSERLCEQGAISGALYRGDDGAIYFYMGS